MRWHDVRYAHPDQWLVVEALEAHSENDHRILDQIAVIDVCPDDRTTMKRYGELRRMHPHREFCFVHTSMAELDIEERLWLGMRGLRAADLCHEPRRDRARGHPAGSEGSVQLIFVIARAFASPSP